MNKNILIISATSGNNFELATKINLITKTIKLNSELINVEDYDIPLFTTIKYKEGSPNSLTKLVPKFLKADGFIICAPEYNGSIPPVLTNLISWISVSTDKWREVFNGKKALIGTHSGGGGNNFIQSMKIQLGHLGIIVLPRTIVVNSSTKFNEDNTKDKIQQLYELL